MVWGASSRYKEVRQAARAGTLLVFVGGIAGVANLLFNVVVARGSGTSGYGVIGPLLVLGTVVGFLATGLQFAIARAAALSPRPARHLLGVAARSSAPWLLPALLLAVFTPLVMSFLRLASPVPVLLVSALSAFTVAGAAAIGLLVGECRFKVIAALLLGSALARVGLGFLLGHGRGAVTGSILASVIPVLVTAILAVVVLLYWHIPVDSDKRSAVAIPEQSRRIGGSGVVGALVSGGLWTIWSLPLVFARHLLTPATAGDFTAAQLLAGAIIWITGPLVTAFYPTIVRHRHRSPIVIGVTATAALSLLGLGGLTLLGPTLMVRLYGGHFSGSTDLFVVLALSATATACATFGCWVALARRRAIPLTLVGLGLALLLEVGLDALLAHTPILLAAGPTVTVTLAAVGIAAVLLVTRSRSHFAHPPRAPDDPATALVAASRISEP